MASPRVLPSGDGWLSLGPASRMLGVDPDTLRRWADEGRLEVFHTPGGHRRFSRRALERLLQSRAGNAHPSLSRLGATPERLTAIYRRRYVSHRPEALGLLRAVPPAQREVFREDGRALVVALLRHLDADDPAERQTALREAGERVRDLGMRVGAAGASLTDAVALFVAARRPFLTELGAIGRRRALTSDQLSRLYDEASAAFDRLLLTFIEGHRTGAES